MSEQAAKPHWSYGGHTGPDHWGGLSYAWELCGCGTAQSPIDIPTGLSSSGKQAPTVAYGSTRVRAVNNGHTLQYSVDRGSTLTWDGSSYALRQFHFHAQSEHTVDGAPAPMEMHLVHEDADRRLAVVGFFIHGTGPNDDTNLWSDGGLLHWPEATELKAGDGPKTFEGPGIDMGKWFDFIQSCGINHYTGSLTTPPCSQGVDWFVVGSLHLNIPDKALEAFQKLYSNNRRPTQPLGSRTVEWLDGN